VTTPAPEGAVNVTALPDVLLAGANPPPEVEPVELKDQVTPWFALSLVSVAVMERVCAVVKPPRSGLTDTLMAEPPPAEVVAEAMFEYAPRLPAASAARTR